MSMEKAMKDLQSLSRGYRYRHRHMYAYIYAHTHTHTHIHTHTHTHTHTHAHTGDESDVSGGGDERLRESLQVGG